MSRVRSRLQVTLGLIGLGTVGTGVARRLVERPHLLADRLGARLVLRRICDRNPRSAQRWPRLHRLTSRHVEDVLRDPAIDIVIELIGGTTTAKRYVLEALRRGKHVVTANKALLAAHGAELFQAAQRANRELAFEASVGGGIPIIKAIREGLVANEFDTILGILNGTSNYILTQMAERGLTFHQALTEAQRHGYAERHPALDVDGHDAAHKLAILTQLAFGYSPHAGEIYVEGIRAITPADLQYAKTLGYVIKPLAVAKSMEGTLELHVHPTLLATSHPLANVRGVYNAIYLHGDLVGSQVFYGRGAGQQPTASAVLADVVDVARRLVYGVPSLRSPVVRRRHPLRIHRIAEIAARYYLRFSVIDRPGVLARIAGILGHHRISISSVTQQERRAARIVPVVIMTHEAQEAQVRRALLEIDRLQVVRRPTVAIRTEGPRDQ